MSITAADVKKLRDLTNAGMSDCKTALTETNGDFEAAIDYLRKKGQKIAAKRADRDANEGVVIARVTADNTSGIVFKLTSETDFVSKNEDFQKFAQSIGDAVIAALPESIDDLKALHVDGVSVGSLIDDNVAKIGEKIDVVGYSKVSADSVVAYNHAGNRIGVLVALNQKANDAIINAGKDVAMQIAAMNPVAVDQEDVDTTIIERELEIAKEQIRLEGKPENMVEKIAQGKLTKFFKENTLLNQDFVKDPFKTIKSMLKEINPELSVKTFKRVALGE